MISGWLPIFSLELIILILLFNSDKEFFKSKILNLYRIIVSGNSVKRMVFPSLNGIIFFSNIDKSSLLKSNSFISIL